jgi:hypothetical protein
MTPNTLPAALARVVGLFAEAQALTTVDQPDVWADKAHQAHMAAVGFIRDHSEPLAAALADARRYQWAIDYSGVDGDLHDKAWDALCGPHTKEYIDAAIDAATKDPR